MSNKLIQLDKVTVHVHIKETVRAHCSLEVNHHFISRKMENIRSYIMKHMYSSDGYVC